MMQSSNEQWPKFEEATAAEEDGEPTEFRNIAQVIKEAIPAAVIGKNSPLFIDTGRDYTLTAKGEQFAKALLESFQTDAAQSVLLAKYHELLNAQRHSKPNHEITPRDKAVYISGAIVDLIRGYFDSNVDNYSKNPSTLPSNVSVTALFGMILKDSATTDEINWAGKHVGENDALLSLLQKKLDGDVDAVAGDADTNDEPTEDSDDVGDERGPSYAELLEDIKTMRKSLQAVRT